MRTALIFSLLCIAFASTCSTAKAERYRRGFSPASFGDSWAQRHAANRPWHGQHYYLQYGQPTALVVPPTAIMQSNYSWGVSRNTMTPTYHQYGRAATPSAGGAFYATPPWPSSTSQFGVYPVRAPW